MLRKVSCRSAATVGLFLLFSAYSVLPATAEYSSSPTVTIKAMVDEAQRVIDDPALSPEPKRLRLRGVLLLRFDTEEMARRALGRHLKKNESRLSEFTALFTKVISDTYLRYSHIEEVRGASVLYLGERISDNYAVVYTRLITTKGQEFEIAYRMRRVGSEWKVYDITIMGISMVGNYRAQFDKIISESSFDELLKRMNK